MQHNFYFGDAAFGVSFHASRQPGRLFVIAITMTPNVLFCELGVAGFVARLVVCAECLKGLDKWTRISERLVSGRP